MAVLPEVLNAQVQSGDEVRTGVYQSVERRCVVVVKVDRKTGKLYYLQSENCTVTLATSWREKFVRDYPISLTNYPVQRAIKAMAHHIQAGFTCHPEAARVIRAILKQ